MDIYLEALNERGTVILDIGKYTVPVVPRIGEKLSLHLTSHPEAYPGPMLFNVIDVRHEIKDIVGVRIAVRVAPTGTAEGIAAQHYLNRLAAREDTTWP